MKKKLALGIGIILLSISMIVNSSMMSFMSKADSSVNVLFDPEQKSVSLNEIFNISLRISNVDDLVRWQLGLQWNSSVVEPASSKAVVEGSFLSDFGSTVFQCPDYNDMGSGTILPISCAFNRVSVPPLPRAHGSGILLNITFKVVGYGEADVSAIGCVLTQSTSKKIYVTSPGNAHISVNLVVKNIAVSWDSACAPRDVLAYEETLVGAIVTNTGTLNATNFSLSFLVNDSLLKSFWIGVLQAGSSRRFSMTWSSPTEGNCILAVRADSLPGEADSDDNCVSASVAVMPRVHDLAVALYVPNNLVVSQTVTLNLTVANLGAFDETNINLTLTIGSEGDNDEFQFQVSMLNYRCSVTLNHNWTCRYVGTYYVSLSVSRLPSEVNSTNNEQVKTVKVVSDQNDILVVSDDGGVGSVHGTSLGEFVSALNKENYSYDVWVESTNGTIKNASLLSSYRVVIWSCGDYSQWTIDPREEEALMTYFENGGNVLLEGEKVASELASRSRFDILSEMLHVKFLRYSVVTTGIEPATSHPITQNLTAANWTRVPARYPDGVEADQKGSTLMRYPLTNFSAVTVVDGSETGTGSVVYFSFSLSDVPTEFGTMLMLNSIRWFNRFGVQTVLSEVIRADPDSVDFIYGNLNGDNGSRFDMIAGGMLYSLCRNEQNQGFADTLASGNSGLICLFGDIFHHETIEHLNTSGILPISICQDPNDPDHFELRNSESNELLYDYEMGSGSSSLFIIQAFARHGVSYLVVCSIDQKGVWAAGVELSRVICKDLRDYCGNYYLFEWADKNGDSIPQLDEMIVLTYG